MTVVLKPCLKETDVIKAPLVGGEERVEIRDSADSVEKIKVRLVQSAWMGLTIFFVIWIVIGMIYADHTKWHPFPKPYRGYCSVPVNDGLEKSQVEFYIAQSPDSRKMNREEKFDLAGKHFMEQLIIEGDVEKMYVANGIDTDIFVYDWKFNISGIIAAARCFLLDVEPRLALPPNVFLDQIYRDEPFAVSVVRTELLAQPVDSSNTGTQLPKDMAEECDHRPLYMLTRMHAYMRKRSAEETKPHFVHFAGKHVREIEITNMAELLELEARKSEKN